jgi:D-inositol-3-phosphate glycosyltransferase
MTMTWCQELTASAMRDTGEATSSTADVHVGLLTGGDDRSYALGLTLSLVAHGVQVDFIGSDKLDAPELHRTPLVRFLNLRGDQSEDVGIARKAVRLSTYYLRLLKYAVVAKPRIFHILWNNKFELFDRTLLMLYYRLLGRRVVLTAHNVNAAKRDSRDSALNRLSLWVQYRLADHVFVHTEKMKAELHREFGAPESKISVIPFGINNTAPISDMTSEEAKQRLGLASEDRTALFFGQIAPYKGLDYLVTALPEVAQSNGKFRLIIAGKVKKGSEPYWRDIEHRLAEGGAEKLVITRIEHIPDSEIELYFKAADVLVIPYTQIFQSGVPFLAYSFGLPVIATDVGSLKDDVMEGTTGILCKPRSRWDLARALTAYFSSEMYRELPATRAEIMRFANDRYSWMKVGQITEDVYQKLLSDA